MGTAEAREALRADSSKASFIAQARAAHLGSAKANALQAKVDRFIEKADGTQVAPNLINLVGGGTVYVAVPGEAHFRDLTPGDSTVTADPCAEPADYGYFCAYEGTYYTGSSIPMYQCHSYNVPFIGAGSWDNNQSTGTRAKMYTGINGAGDLSYTTRPAHSWDADGDWTPVGSVVNC
ncbi:hypothetical protein ACFV2X_07155 [Streptomyces sp. NPDC059679]|uniref:hypothetical protein n=1 Tax=Streptomyces sp. NPDC059679 TaxID=3346903 RepID=UPI00367C5CF9